MHTVALFILSVLGGYLAVGVVFGLAFVTRGIARVDSVAHGASFAVRALLLPGSVLLWPILIRMWISASRKSSIELLP